MTEYDVIVVGIGGMGSATIYNLAQRGCRALGLEQGDIPHELGSSHGISRIIRLAYAEHPNYVPLLPRAYELWRQIESFTGERLLIMTGGIDAGGEASSMVTGSLDGFKFCSVIGEIMSELVLDGGTKLDIEMFRLSRFAQPTE
jgi:sarcosine oxidase